MARKPAPPAPKSPAAEAPRSPAAPKGKAAALIAAIQSRGGSNATTPPNEEGMAELRAVLEHNDVCTWGERVSADAAIEMLRELGWTGSSITALNRLCRSALGRKSFNVAS